MKNESYMNLALIVTGIRFVLVCPIVLLIFSGFWQGALGLFGMAAITDWLDGIIARAWQCETALGAVLDPLADKCLVLAVCTSVRYMHPWVMPWWFLSVLWAKELLLVFGGGVLYGLSSGWYAIPSPLGKAAMFLEIILVSMLMLSLAWPESFMWLWCFTPWVMGLVLIIAVGAGCDYLNRVRKVYTW